MKKSLLTIHLRDFLNNYFASISNALSRTLQWTNTKSVLKYKQYLKTIINHKYVLEKAKFLQAKINTNSITFTDLSQINELNELLTSGMLKAERIIVVMINNTHGPLPSLSQYYNLQSRSSSNQNSRPKHQE